MFAMNLALVANNIGLMWVAIELATLTTVLMVGIYRTPRGARGGLEVLHPRQRRHRARAVRHHPRLSWRRGRWSAKAWMPWPGRVLVTRARALRSRRCSTSPSCSCCWATAPRSAWRRCTPGCPMPMPRARRRSRRCSRGCCSTSRCIALLRFKLLLAANPAALAPGPLMVTHGPGLARVRLVHAVPAARHQAHVRLLLDRAHGDHHLRLRHGRRARQLRRPACT